MIFRLFMAQTYLVTVFNQFKQNSLKNINQIEKHSQYQAGF
jgi:hypothetical protein